MEDISGLFDSFSKMRIGVIGDVMLDTYMWGHVERISPEAPVPVVSLDKEELRIGGAGNVALNLAALGAKAHILSVTGQDENAENLERLLKENNIDTTYLVKSSHRITTNKIRIISRNQQMMRLDAEITTDLEEEDEELLVSAIQQFIAKAKPDALVFEDYNKGVLTKNIIQKAIMYCQGKRVLMAVDPKSKNFFEYKGVDLFKPNLKEVREAFNLHFENISVDLLTDIHQRLKEKLRHDISLITLSEKGIFYQNEKNKAIIPSHLRKISDVSGAGDTVIAVASLVYAATGNIHLAAEVSNIAGGLVCEQVGTIAVDRDRLFAECELLLS